MSALMVASSIGSLDALKIIVQSNADMNIVDSQKRNALHFACASGRKDHAELLLRYFNSHKDDRTAGGNTPLMCAVQSG